MPLLSVPYWPQPDSATCQSTCLKMMASYLDEYIGRPIVRRNIFQIKASLKSRGNKVGLPYNHFDVMKWWLEQDFPTEFTFTWDGTTDHEGGFRRITRSIDSHFPVIVSTNHSRSKGHIILVVGYEKVQDSNISISPTLICHDPYGDKEGLWGKGRWQMTRGDIQPCHPEGEDGSGRAVEYDINGIRRVLADRHSQWTFYQLRPTNIGMSGG